MAEQNSSEEVDLGIVFNRIRGFYHSFLISFYRALKFLIRNLVIIIILVIIGLVLGYFLDRNLKHNKQTELIVQINFDGGNYIYNTIAQLQNKIQDKDTVYLKDIGLYENGETLLKSIEISPIVSITEILKKTPENDRNVDLFLQQAQYEDQLLTSEIFIPEYKTHKIELIASDSADYNTINTLIEYLNDNKILQQSKEITIESSKLKIRENKLSIIYIDSVTKNYGSRSKSEAPAGQIYINTMQSNIDYLHMLFREKVNIMEELQSLQIELLKYGEPVVLLNKPVLQIKKSLFSKKMFVLPLLFFIFFIIISIIISLFRTARRLSDSKI